MTAKTRPKIVCLCGSTKFWQDYLEQNAIESKAGNIVLSVGFFVHAPDVPGARGIQLELSPADKMRLDELHLRKIDMADEVFVLNRGGYMGDSTMAEVAYAIAHNKPLKWLEPPRLEQEYGR